MCGIAGVINYHPDELELIKRTLIHRGPDEQTIFTENNLALIHTRLSIQDIANGKQPFHVGPYTIIFNGEIYNHLSLRELMPEVVFKTNSDTETLLYLFIKFHENMFEYIDGMFAFCIVDRTHQQLFFARDRAGKKPLYYYKERQRFIFASEINTIKAACQLEINHDAVTAYLRAGFIYHPYTAYQSVFELEAGSWMTVDMQSLQSNKQKYFSILPYYKTKVIPFADAVSSLDEHLTQSIKSRLLSSDVEVGAFLSGGIDSNLIVAIASRMHPQLKTFTVKFTGLADEADLAQIGANHYRTNHTEIEVKIDILKDVKNILQCYGEPFMDSSAIPSYYVAKAAREHVTVVLNGDGADELFGGYRRYVPSCHWLLKSLQYFHPVKKYLPLPSQKQSSYNYLYRLLCLGQKKGLDFYLAATTDIFDDYYDFPQNPILDAMHNDIATVLEDAGLTPLSKMLYLDFNLLLFCDLLVKMDIATMANSLEARSPFLSKSLLCFAPQLPDHYKINGLKTKYILRELAKKYLPKTLINQPKRGFEVPLLRWINNDLRSIILDNLSPGCFSENYFDRDFLNQLRNQQLPIPPEKRAKMLWTLFCLETWLREERISHRADLQKIRQTGS